MEKKRCITREQIVFSSEGRDVAPRINLINRDGTGLKELRRGIGSVSEPAWSPDGETIVYSTSQGLFLTSANGPELHQINVPGSPNWLIFPSWSPDGKKLALIGSNSDNFYGPYNIYLVNRDGGGLNAINDIVAGVGHLTWSPDGKKIAFRSYQDCGDINILDLDTGNITNLTNSVGVAELDPAWSADGNYIAYSKGFYERCAQDQVYYDQGENIYVIQIDGENETQLTTTGGNHPVWWPKVILRSNWKYSVTKAGSGLNVREVATTSAKSLIKLKPGEVFTALEGSIDAEGYHWQRVRTESGIEGWCVDVPGWYMFDSAD